MGTHPNSSVYSRSQSKSEAADKAGHFLDGAWEAYEDGTGDEGVADADFLDFGDGCDVANVGVIETVAGVDTETKRCRVGGGIPDAAEVVEQLLLAPRVGEFACVQLDDVGAYLRGGFDLLIDGIDENTYLNIVLMQGANCLLNLLRLFQDVETGFGGEFLALLGHERREIGQSIDSDLHDLVGNRHLEIELGLDRFAQQAHIAVVDVSSILTQVTDYTLGAMQLADLCGGDGIGFESTAGFAKRGEMIDVDAESHGGDR